MQIIKIIDIIQNDLDNKKYSEVRVGLIFLRNRIQSIKDKSIIINKLKEQFSNAIKPSNLNVNESEEEKLIEQIFLNYKKHIINKKS